MTGQAVFCAVKGLACAGVAVCVLLQPAWSQNEYPYYLYQRTLYLEDATVPGSWWANPAVLAQVESPVLLASNVTPLGDRYVVAAARVLFPVKWGINAGVGFLGSGPYRAGSSEASVSNSGFSASGQFLFSQPNLHVGAGYRLPVGGNIGALIALGWESVYSSFDRTDRYATFSLGAGWISPYAFNMVCASLSLLGTYHSLAGAGWEWDGKAGLQFGAGEDLVRAVSDFTFSAVPGLTIPWGSAQFASEGYQVFKTLVSLRMFWILGGLVGVSSDLRNFRVHSIGGEEDNGTCVHLGLEVRRSDTYPFYGGYEMGISATWGRLIHRLWFAYEFTRRASGTRKTDG